MFPCCIIPHPFQRKAVVVFQSGSTNPFIAVHYESSKFIEVSKDLSNYENKDAYTILVKFFRYNFFQFSFKRQQAEVGNDFIGYYLDNKLVYHFIFMERVISLNLSKF
jgi:hypothetical protein